MVFEERERKDMMCSELWDEMDEGKLGTMHRASCKNTPIPTEFALTTSVLPLPLKMSDAPLAQLDRASDYGSEGWGFDSLKARHAGRQSSSVKVFGKRLLFRVRFFVKGLR